MKKFLIIISLFFTFSNGATLKTLENDNIKKPILVIISQDYCKYCEKQKHEIKKDKELFNLIVNNFQFIELNRSRVFIPKKLYSRGSPAIFFLNENGKIIWKNIGYMKADMFKYQIKKVLSRMRR